MKNMFKIAALSLAVLMLAFAFVGCGKKDDGKADNADAPADSLALLTKVWDSYTDDEKFPAAGGDYENPVEDAPGAVSIADADNLNYMLTLPVEDAGALAAALREHCPDSAIVGTVLPQTDHTLEIV